MIDFHSHILPGMDDGAKDLAEALAIATILSEAGFSEIHCTPHCIAGAYEAAPFRIRREVEELQAAIDVARIPLRVLAGSEYYCDEFLLPRLDDPLTLGESNLVLMEAPLQATPSLLSSTAYQVVRRGFIPLIAHPERCAVLQSSEKDEAGAHSLLGSVLKFANARLGNHNPHRTESALPDLLRSMGCRFQGNLGSFAGIYGERVRRQAIRNLRNGLYDCLGTDAHASRGLGEWLPRGLREVESHVGREGLAALLSRASMPAGSPLRTAIGR